jgi:hypothetical protein
MLHHRLCKSRACQQDTVEVESGPVTDGPRREVRSAVRSVLTETEAKGLAEVT